MLAAGTRLGPYKILAPLGAGGMGDVYRAHDTRLGRDVAIKVLSPLLAPTPEVRARFEREARTISQLNHPHICTLFDVGHQDGIDYLVMELLEGETLAHRIEKGPLPVVEVLTLGAQIADALDVAHRHGIVHRDLKPGNVMLTKAGAKLMDFGLARAAGLPAAPETVMDSPTMSRPLTAEGTIVGTFQYMAPEQLEGQEADPRTDIFAFGAVLYEMAAGKPAFEGKSRASLIAKILEKEPVSLSSLVPLVPPALEQLVKRCLAKDPDDRWQSARDIVHDLGWILEGGSKAGVPVPIIARRKVRERLAWLLAGLAATAALASGLALLVEHGPRPTVTRFTIPCIPGLASMSWPRISPDGLTIAFLGTDSTGTSMIWVRPMKAPTARPLPGTDDAGRPFWSPDSRFIAFFAGDDLKKVALSGGPPLLICKTPRAADGAWGRKGVILYDGSSSDSLRCVSAEGGMPAAATSFDRSRGETMHAWPCFLPDGRHFIYVAYGKVGSNDRWIKTGCLDSKDTKILAATESRVEYAPEGYLLYVLGSTLVAHRFDARKLQLEGDPVPVAEPALGSAGLAHFFVSQVGVMTFMQGAGVAPKELVWFDRSGRRLETVGPPAEYAGLALSPDERSVAYCLPDPRTTREQLWLRDLRRGLASRLTFHEARDVWPIWSKDGAWIAYTRSRGWPSGITRVPANGAGEEETLYQSDTTGVFALDWSPDGQWIAMMVGRTTNMDIWMLPLGGDRKPVPFATRPFFEGEPRFSPDGRWIAYTSMETGRAEVYVRPFRGSSGKWQISAAGGEEPHWRSDGHELFYRGPKQELMVVPIQAGTTLDVGNPTCLFVTETVSGQGFPDPYQPTADGERFLLAVPVQHALPVSFNVVLNWGEELKRE